MLEFSPVFTSRTSSWSGFLRAMNRLWRSTIVVFVALLSRNLCVNGWSVIVVEFLPTKVFFNLTDGILVCYSCSQDYNLLKLFFVLGVSRVFDQSRVPLLFAYILAGKSYCCCFCLFFGFLIFSWTTCDFIYMLWNALFVFSIFVGRWLYVV